MLLGIGMWILVSLQLPPRSAVFDCCTIDVLVSDGEKIGIGHYDYDMEYWIYHFVGQYESEDNKIKFWMMLPDKPK